MALFLIEKQTNNTTRRPSVLISGLFSPSSRSSCLLHLDSGCSVCETAESSVVALRQFHHDVYSREMT